jgi:hypothetical protein
MTVAAAGGATMVLLAVLACVAPVDGERAASGACPEGEACSSATPQGLTFVGTAFYDDLSSGLRLGPVLEGGTFSLGFRTSDGAPLPPFDVQAADPRVLTSSPGTGEFLGGTDGSRLEVQAHVTLHGLAAGQTHVRVRDPATDELHDRLLFDVYELESIELVNVADPRREHLLAGCEEMIGVRLVAKEGRTRFRAIDQELSLVVDGEPMERERGMWDCFLYTPDEDQGEAVIEVGAVKKTFVHVLPVRTLEEVALEACPARTARD